MSEKQSKQIEEEFFKALRDIQDRFPMCVVEAFTPTDFAYKLAEGEGASLSNVKCDWSDHKWLDIANKVSQDVDWGTGLSWDSIERAIDDVEEDIK